MFFRKFLSFILSFLFLFEVFTLKSSAIRVAAGEDLSDIAVPIDSSVTNAAIGNRLEISAKSVHIAEFISKILQASHLKEEIEYLSKMA